MAQDLIINAVVRNTHTPTYEVDEHAQPRAVLSAVQADGSVLQFAPTWMKDNEIIAIAAVRQRGMSLSFASRRLQNDAGVVTAAVQHKATALKHAFEDMRNNRAVVMPAVEK